MALKVQLPAEALFRFYAEGVLGYWDSILLGFSVCLQPINLFYCFIGVFVGTLIGVLPGVGPVATISMLLPATFKMSPVGAIIMLAGIYYGAMYGGSTTSILVNIPGETASVVTCLDGYQMARQGRAGPALGIAAFGSFIAGTFSVVALTFVAPPLATIAIRFGPPEYFSLLVLGLTLFNLSGPRLDDQGPDDGLRGPASELHRAGQYFRVTSASLTGFATLEDGIGLVPGGRGGIRVGRGPEQHRRIDRQAGDFSSQNFQPSPQPAGLEGLGHAHCPGDGIWVSSWGSFPEGGTSWLPLPLMPLRSVFPNIRRNSVREPSKGWPGRNRRTTPGPAGSSSPS